MKIALGSDHAGYAVKETVRKYMESAGYDVVNYGTDSEEPVDYPDFAEKVAVAVRDGLADLGVLVCGTGIGVSIAANKVAGIRAATVWSTEMARLSRQHNNANVLCLPGRYIELQEAVRVVEKWLATSFEGGRHAVRVEKVKALEGRC